MPDHVLKTCVVRPLLLLAVLSGCATTSTPEEHTHEPPPCDLALPEAPLYAGFADLGQLMVFRQSICAEPAEDRSDAAQAHRDSHPEAAPLIDLMLASCEPHQTPGLLAEAVRAARAAPETPPGFFAFLDLLQSQHSAYMRLGDRHRATEKRLDAIIEGIRDIEAEMGTDNGSANTQEVDRD